MRPLIISMFLLTCIILLVGISGCFNDTYDPPQQEVQNIKTNPEHTVRPEDQIAEKIKVAMDSDSSITRNYALSLIDKKHGGQRNTAQLCDMWEKVYKDWTYVSDPRGFEYFSSASNTIQIGLKGDCDDFAILIASLVESIGGKSRIILAQGVQGGGHAYAEVYIGDNEEIFKKNAQYVAKRYKANSIDYNIQYDENKKPRYWLNLDWQSRHPGGKYYDSTGIKTAYYSNGYWYKMRARN